MVQGERPMRSGAFNYRKASWNTNNCSVLQKKVGILLGLRHAQTRSVTDILVNTGLETMSDEQLRHSPSGPTATDPAIPGDIESPSGSRIEYQEVPFAASMGRNEERLLREIAIFKDKSLDPLALRSGVQLDRYQVASTRTEDGFQLILRPDPRSSGWTLGSYPTREEAITVANDLRRLLVRLNAESEGFHVVEHILLRPMNPATLPDTTLHETEVPEDFYPFTISVIFPAWTARFNDDMFRRLAEGAVQINCPAHIYPEYYWLDFPRMREFEGLYQQWLSVKGGGPPDAPKIDAASTLLKKFILGIRAEASGCKGDKKL